MAFDPIARQLAQNAVTAVEQYVAQSQDDPTARASAASALALAQQAYTEAQDALFAAQAAGTGSSSGGFIPPPLFTAIAISSPPSAVSQFTTAGYSSVGIGAGTYVADALATSALAAASPRFCTHDSTGRYWRLLPGPDGFLNLSQAGAVPLSGVGNAQPYVQGLIDYAKAIGCSFIRHDLAAVDLWCPTRTSSAADGDAAAFALDGQPIVIQASLHIEGLPGKSAFNFKGPTGGAWATDFQNIGGTIWRGSMVNIMGGTKAAPAANAIDFFAMKNIKLNGGTAWDGVRTPSTIISPVGVDLSNKGIRCQNTEIRRVWLEDVEICGVQGELYYMAASDGTYGTFTVEQKLNRVSIHDSNQSAFNPSDGTVDVTDCAFGNAWAAYEILGGIGGRLHNCAFYNFVQASATGGPANGLLYNYAYPTRISGAEPPWLDFIDCTWSGNIASFGGNIFAINYVRMTGVCTDCYGLSSILSNGALVSTHIDLVMIYDQIGPTYAWGLIGPSSTVSTASAPVAPPNSGTFAGSSMDITVPLADLGKFTYNTPVYITDGTTTINATVITTFGVMPEPVVMSVFVNAVNGSTLSSSVPPGLTLASGAAISCAVPGSGNVLMQKAVDVKVRLRIRRTPVARAAALAFSAFSWTGEFDQDTCTVILDEGDGIAGINVPSVYAPAFSGMPLVQINCPTNSNVLGAQSYYAQLATGNRSASPAFTGSSIAAIIEQPIIGLYNLVTVQTVTVTLPNPHTAPYGYANGQKLMVGYFGGTIYGTVFKIAQYAQGVRLKADRKLWGPDDWLLLEWHTEKLDPVSGLAGVWVETGYISTTYHLYGAGSITPASLASGAMAALGTVTVTNAAVGDMIDSVTASSATGGVNLWGEVTAANTVTIYARNDKGSAYAPGATTYTVTGRRA